MQVKRLFVCFVFLIGKISTSFKVNNIKNFYIQGSDFLELRKFNLPGS